MKQQNLFSKQTQLAAARRKFRSQLPSKLTAPDGKSIRTADVASVLDAVDSFDRCGDNGERCYASIQTIATQAGVSLRQCKRSLRLLTDLCILGHTKQYRGQRPSVTRFVNLANLQDVISDLAMNQTEGQICTSVSETEGQILSTEGQICTSAEGQTVPTKAKGEGQRKELIIITNSSAPDRHRNATDVDDDWSGIVSEIASRGVTAAVSARNAAQRAGLTPRDVRDILQHWDDQGAILGLSAVHLYVRLRDAHPELAPGDGWMPGEVKTHAHAQQAKRDAKPVERQEQALTAGEIELIDSLTDDQVAGAIRDHYGPGAMCRVWQRRAATKITRHHPMIAAAIMQTRSTRDGEESSDTRSRQETSSVRQAAELAYASC